MTPRSYTVFAQGAEGRLELVGWQRYAESFLEASVTAAPDDVDSSTLAPGTVRVSVCRRGGKGAIRTVYLRPRTEADLEAAESAERMNGGAGLSLLARRCPGVVVVSCASEVDGDALLLAATIAGVALGPILTPDRLHLWGVTTARRELEKLAAS